MNTTACTECRARKIRCSRQTPACLRCVQRGERCQYPQPPDRRHLASLRYQQKAASKYVGEARLGSPRRRVTSETESVDGRPSNLSSLPGEKVAVPQDAAKELAVPTIENFGWLDAAFPQKELGLFLIEIYFTRTLTASLLFDYQDLVSDYHGSCIPDYVCLSIFAVASLCLRPTSESPIARKIDLDAFTSLNKKGEEWAEIATRSALLSAASTSLSTIRACDNLCLYWFAVGRIDCSRMMSTVSRQAFELLCGKTTLDHANRQPNSSHRKHLSILQRLDWACKLKTCLAECEGASHASTNISRFVPAENQNRRPSGENNLRGHANDWLIWDEMSPRCSISHLIHLFDLWSQIKHHVRRYRDLKPSEYTAAVFELDTRLYQVYGSIPPELKRQSLMDNNFMERAQRNAFLMHSVYYLSIVYLHMSTVPAFSGVASAQPLSPNFSESSARIAVTNAKMYCEWCKGYLSTIPDFSKVPPFVGYCVYVAGSIMATLWANGMVSESHRFTSTTEGKDGITCVLFLRELKRFWPILDDLCHDLWCRFRMNSEAEYKYSEHVIIQEITQWRPTMTLDTRGCDATISSLGSTMTELQLQLPNSFTMRSYVGGNDEAESKDDNAPFTRNSSDLLETTGSAFWGYAALGPQSDQTDSRDVVSERQYSDVATTIPGDSFPNEVQLGAQGYGSNCSNVVGPFEGEDASLNDLFGPYYDLDGGVLGGNGYV